MVTCLATIIFYPKREISWEIVMKFEYRWVVTQFVSVCGWLQAATLATANFNVVSFTGYLPSNARILTHWFFYRTATSTWKWRHASNWVTVSFGTATNVYLPSQFVMVLFLESKATANHANAHDICIRNWPAAVRTYETRTQHMSVGSKGLLPFLPRNNVSSINAESN